MGARWPICRGGLLVGFAIEKELGGDIGQITQLELFIDASEFVSDVGEHLFVASTQRSRAVMRFSRVRLGASARAGEGAPARDCSKSITDLANYLHVVQV